MSKKQIPSVANDFTGVLSFLKTRGIIPATPPSPLTAYARRMHRATYSLILWKFRLKGIPEHGKVFIEEIASDALQVLPQSLMGYGKTARLLTRGVIENTMRHIYFMDHAIEFARMNREQKWYPGMDELFEYPSIHPLYLGIEPKFDAVNRLKNLYSELSASVHGRRVQDLEMRTSLEHIAFDKSVFETQVKQVESCAEAVNFLLSVFHANQVHNFQPEDRKIIMMSMPARARSLWRDLE